MRPLIFHINTYFGVDVVAGGVRIPFLVRGGRLVREGWPLAVGGVCGWSARWLPSHPLVLFVHGGLWPGGVGRWAVVVVRVVLVVVLVGPLVVVVWVVVGLVLRVWPMDPFWVFRSPLWGWGVGHRGQSPGLHHVVGRGGGSGAGLDGDGGRGVPRPWVGLAGGGGGLWGMDDGALGDGDADEGLDGVVLGGRLCGGGGCRRVGGAGCSGWGVLAWARVRAGVVSGGFVSLRLWCCVCSRGRRLGFSLTNMTLNKVVLPAGQSVYQDAKGQPMPPRDGQRNSTMWMGALNRPTPRTSCVSTAS